MIASTVKWKRGKKRALSVCVFSFRSALVNQPFFSLTAIIDGFPLPLSLYNSLRRNFLRLGNKMPDMV